MSQRIHRNPLSHPIGWVCRALGRLAVLDVHKIASDLRSDGSLRDKDVQAAISRLRVLCYVGSGFEMGQCLRECTTEQGVPYNTFFRWLLAWDRGEFTHCCQNIRDADARRIHQACGENPRVKNLLNEQPSIARYTAARIARALGISAPAIRKALRGAKAGFALVRGQMTAVWSVDALPMDMQRRLSAIVSAEGRRGVHDLLSSPSERFQPSVPVSDLPQHIVEKASRLRAAIAPVLESAEVSSFSELAKKASARLALDPMAIMLAPRTLRRIIARIVDRDAGLREFGRLELYAEEFAVSIKEPHERRCAGPVPLRLATISESDPDAVAEESIFEAAAQDLVELKAKIKARLATGIILDFIEERWPTLEKSRNAIRMRMDRAINRDGSSPEKKRGPKPIALLNDAELRMAKALYVTHESKTLALRKLAGSPACRQEVADVILKRRSSKHTITPALRGQLVVPDAVMDWHKSPKKVRRESFITPRTKTFLDRSGAEQRLLPGMLAERDDMSNNFIFWIDWPWGGDPCSDKYGVRIARGQNLLHIDVASLRFLSMNMLVRLRDSYRADDIWQWVGQTYRDLGIPQIGERWERGIWNANQLHGTPIKAGHTGQEQRLGGIQALGRKITTSQSPTTKIIENRFRFYQRICKDIPGQIGAFRGEMEKVSKLWTACRAGSRDPRDYFLSYEDAVSQLEGRLQDVNSEQVEGAIYNGIPNDIWIREGGEKRMTRLTADQSYLFSRDRHVVTVNKGQALVRKSAPDGVRLAWYFHCEDLWRFEGRKVALFMNDFAPAEGATVVLADRQGEGKVVGFADLVEGCPQFALGVDFNGGRGATAALAALDRRKVFADAVRCEYRALGLTHTIARGTYAADGAGRSRSLEKSPAIEETNIRPFRDDKGKEIKARAASAFFKQEEAREFSEREIDEINRMEAETIAREPLCWMT